MPLPIVPCEGKMTVHVRTGNREEARELVFEALRVRKIFDEFVLRDCVEGIVFDIERKPADGIIEPALILRNGTMSNVQIKDASVGGKKRLYFSGTLCCEVFGKDKKGSLMRLRTVYVPEGSGLSVGADGTLCFDFSIKRNYSDTSSQNFEKLVHFLEQGRFNLQALAEAVIDEENSEAVDLRIVTNLGLFAAVKLEAEVELVIPVLGCCGIQEDTEGDLGFADEFARRDIPVFNPPSFGSMD